MGDSSSIRTFIAIELPENIKLNLKLLITSLQKEIDTGNIKWVNPNNIHLTIKFLGTTDLLTIQKITNSIKTISPSLISPKLQIAKLGAFPNLLRPKTLWVGCSYSRELLEIFTMINTICSNFKFPVEKREFSPHLTIGRVNSTPSSDTINKIQFNFKKSNNTNFGEFYSPKLTIFKSDLTPSGPIYTVLQRIDLS